MFEYFDNKHDFGGNGLHSSHLTLGSINLTIKTETKKPWKKPGRIVFVTSKMWQDSLRVIDSYSSSDVTAFHLFIFY